MDPETPDDMSALPALVESGVGYAVAGTNGSNPFRRLFCCTSNAHGSQMLTQCSGARSRRVS